MFDGAERPLLITIWPGFASSQSREARFMALP